MDYTLGSGRRRYRWCRTPGGTTESRPKPGRKGDPGREVSTLPESRKGIGNLNVSGAHDTITATKKEGPAGIYEEANVCTIYGCMMTSGASFTAVEGAGVWLRFSGGQGRFT
jgi:hypothetical protein